MVYAICAVTVIGLTGSQYALMPSAVTDTFGEKYASMNMGLVYMSTVRIFIAQNFVTIHDSGSDMILCLFSPIFEIICNFIVFLLFSIP